MAVEHVVAGSVHDLFAERVRADPDLTAVVCGRHAPTFRELAERVDLVAGGLLARGVRPEEPVGLFLERGVDAVAGVLAILRAGGAVLPLTTDLPDARLAELLADAGAAVVLTRRRLAHRLPPALTPAARVVLVEDDHPPHPAP
ncbi:AMP-binding protein, partial [Saccharothrix longispora]|uniref:AMP-binding protein n=1 Tax=Saccharothrix longispora TaxID=33920 RepID=UPI0028FD5D43